MKQIFFITVLATILLSSCSESIPFDYAKNETAEQKEERMQWWKDAKFGMFIHWGGYAHLGGVYRGDTARGAARSLRPVLRG